MKFKKGDIVKNILEPEIIFIIYSDEIINNEMTLIKYDNPDFMILSHVMFLELDTPFIRKLKIEKLYERIKT